MRINKFLTIFLIMISPPSILAKEIALTFDDAPRAVGPVFTDGIVRAQKLVSELSLADVKQVAFFVNSSGLDESGLKRMAVFTNAGHLLGNHTHSHLNINEVSANTFVADAVAGHQALMNMANFKFWFRFPYLREGDKAEKRDAVRAQLKDIGYQNAYITVNNYDWHMDSLLKSASQRADEVDYGKLREIYLEVLLACANFYDDLAIKALGRSPKHIFLLHETDLNTLFIGDLARELRRDGWKIIAPEEAYSDPIAEYQTSNIFLHNPGRVGEIAKDVGLKGPFWHESCNEKYLEDLFSQRQVFKSKK